MRQLLTLLVLASVGVAQPPTTKPSLQEELRQAQMRVANLKEQLRFAIEHVRRLVKKMEGRGETPAKPPSRHGRPIEERIKAEINSLVEKIVVTRNARMPKHMLALLNVLVKHWPDDGAVHFLVGEIYVSTGEMYDAKKAKVAFEKFLDVTSGGGNTNSKLWQLVPFGTLQSVRMDAQRYLLNLSTGHTFITLTSATTLTKMRAETQAAIKTKEKIIEDARYNIRQCEKKIDRIRRERKAYPDTRSRRIGQFKRSILSYEQRIGREQERIKVLNEKLTWLRGGQ